jgi:hypothetical protein
MQENGKNTAIGIKWRYQNWLAASFVEIEILIFASLLKHACLLQGEKISLPLFYLGERSVHTSGVCQSNKVNDRDPLQPLF